MVQKSWNNKVLEIGKRDKTVDSLKNYFPTLLSITLLELDDQRSVIAHFKNKNLTKRL